uniref:Uncharacterized protein LOC8266935 n=1 Tax=Rhizophora mucronata TaxID=61149 RepID=A0A2P2JQ69_RHIMU
MVRCLCFNAHVQSHRPRKTVETSVEAMSKSLQDPSQVQAPKTTTMKPSSLDKNAQITGSANDVSSFLSAEGKSKSEEIKVKFGIESEKSAHQTRIMKKSQSLGSGLCHAERIFSDNDTKDDIEQGFSVDMIHQKGFAGADGTKDQGVSLTGQQSKNESIFSFGDPQQSDRAIPENFDTVLSGESDTPRTPPMIVKSYSMPALLHYKPYGHCSFGYLAPHSRSSEDFNVLNIRRKETSVHEVLKAAMDEHGRDDIMCKTEKNNGEISLDDGYDSYNYSSFAKDWIVPVMDAMHLEKDVQGESSFQHGDEVPSKDFKIKRIEEWVNDLQHCSSMEETNELPDISDMVNRDSTMLNGLNAAKVDGKIASSMEAAKKYISTLTPSSTFAQLSNHGLALIPFLSAFVGLKMLNLSGNSIAKITAGALPRGLHMLNLSKNSISTIEGLRDLTRLRVLDLSYNRITRIGHGLASCSSLKELYLAGNKISEVEGLHRLLKLAVLDLRFNKISTAKCLGQLAANYNSLQAISLEGNPAQKNVGDEQLRKYLLGLLPHLVYFNRQPVKANTLKDAAERSVRLGISAHQFDRGLRADNKVVRKASHGLAASRPSSALARGRKSQAAVSPKRSRGKHIRLPPAGTKATTSNRQQPNYDLSSKIFNLKSELSMRRSRSEGTLGAL